MIDEKCQRCNWPIVGDGKIGCHLGKNGGGDCSCVCASYPTCACGLFDQENPDVPMTVPKGTVIPTAAAVAFLPGQLRTELPLVSSGPTMVILHQVDSGKASIVYIGKDKGKAFDSIMGFDKAAKLGEFTMEEEK